MLTPPPQICPNPNLGAFKIKAIAAQPLDNSSSIITQVAIRAIETTKSAIATINNNLPVVAAGLSLITFTLAVLVIYNQHKVIETYETTIDTQNAILENQRNELQFQRQTLLDLNTQIANQNSLDSERQIIGYFNTQIENQRNELQSQGQLISALHTRVAAILEGWRDSQQGRQVQEIQMQNQIAVQQRTIREQSSKILDLTNRLRNLNEI